METNTWFTINGIGVGFLNGSVRVWEFFRVKRKGVLLEREWGKGERVRIFRSEKKKGFVSRCLKEWGKVRE